MQSLLSPHMFEGGAVHDGEASLANHLGARPVHVAALVVAAKEVVVGRHLDIGRRVHHSKVWIGGRGDWFLYLNLFGCCTESTPQPDATQNHATFLYCD